MSWKKELKRNVRTVDELKEYVNIPQDVEEKLRKVVEIHPMNVTRYYLSLIDWNDSNDPIKRMAIPSPDELSCLEGDYDTSGEHENTKMRGLQHKYSETALVLATNRCAVYCRYCFRKRMVGLTRDEVIRRLDRAVKYIEEHEEVTNVLISGGDPFVLDNKIIKRFLNKLVEIPHLDFIRFGSRVPVTFPMRLNDDDLPEILGEFAELKRIYVVTHYNHPKEFTEESTGAIKRLLDNGIVVSNQAVLLKGVNDDPYTLAELHRLLVRYGIVPYYVFQCRPVKRVKGIFQVPLKEGYKIVERAKAMLDGHSKRFRYIMSHRTGKIEIVGVDGDYIYLKYHQAKDKSMLGKLFRMKLTENAGWLDDLEVAE
ncbi:KamA family radical SAM protein [Archaeoglobus profundus]|uniref:Lysine 2,3-aminomutase YodO family protein n=1 Tax=Archaeoglobus profundus (strain DSM 5631 / JCM 9629 / NBRC 100127 / Av18) TaxID=572546 RepID=D2RD98_ARCPA|nr:KamA family radical SAM protein [Archaeoglobus profundus]ADB58092.1 lysine 2,3-aminomutase YodO family protein [Archaeoglobus profundus DSM 5631]